MKEIRHLKTIKNKRNLNTKWLVLQNDQNADTTLLHSHDEISLLNFAFFTAKSPSVTQTSVSQENTFKKSKNPPPFFFCVCV